MRIPRTCSAISMKLGGGGSCQRWRNYAIFSAYFPPSTYPHTDFRSTKDPPAHSVAAHHTSQANPQRARSSPHWLPTPGLHSLLAGNRLKVPFTDDGWQDDLCWSDNERKLLWRVNGLIGEIQWDPFRGTGKPEPPQRRAQGVSSMVGRETATQHPHGGSPPNARHDPW
jgi:Txe/YoeB family toxin of Txe-Axe toxin-antitoxin module